MNFNVSKIRTALLIILTLVALGHFIYQTQFKSPKKTPKPKTEKTTKIKKKKQPVKWLVFKDQKENISLRYPETWQLQDHSASNESLRAHIAKDETGGLQVLRLKKDKSTPFKEFLDAYLKKFKADMLQNEKGAIADMGVKFEKIGTHEGYSLALIHTGENNEKSFLKQFLWTKNNHVYALQARSNYGHIHIFEPLFDRIAGSFKMTE